jgi:hypothetical protein
MSSERDDTTRYLAAAAHLDDRFADRAIREFLTEPTRSAPPVAGVRAGAVLAEAVAARARRKLRDTLLVTLFAGVLVTLSLSIVIAWLLIGVSVFVVLARKEPARRRVPPAVGGGLIAVGLLVLLVRTGDLGTSFDELTLATALVTLLLVALLTVLLVDEFVVWRHLEDRFPRGCLLTEPDPAALSPQVRRVFLFGARRFLTQLRRHLHRQRIVAAGGGAPVLVTSGHRRFVGAGEPHDSWTLTVPLRPDAGHARPPRLAALYDHVVRAMGCGTEQVVVSEKGLDKDFLADPTSAPYPLLRGQRVRELRDRPREGARCYLRFEVEPGVSAFLHLAVRDANLYVEWTPCVLPPVREEYRAIDTMRESPLLPVARAVLRFLTLPMSVPYRLRTVCSVIRRPATPDRYGVPFGLSELAAGTEVWRPAQLKEFERRLTHALAEALVAAGYEVAALRRHAAGAVS